MAKWTRIASVSDCLPGMALELVADDRIVALFNVEGEFHALDGICPHQGGPLGKGSLGTGAGNCIVTCPWHGWQFDVRDGQHQATAALQHTVFAVRVVDGEVFVDLEP